MIFLSTRFACLFARLNINRSFVLWRRILALAVIVIAASSAAAANPSDTLDQLTLRWQHALHAPVSATPVVVEQQLFVATESGNVHAFDLRTHNQLWLYHTEAAIASTPAVADGRVYFLSRDGYFYALEQATGKLLWRFATQGEARFAAVGGYGTPAEYGPVTDPWDFYASSPLVHAGKVYFGSSDHHLYALNAATGALVWSFKADAPIHSSPRYASNKIFVGTWGTRLYAVDAQTGNEVWQFQGGVDPQHHVMQGITASPTVDGQCVYIGARDGFMYALNVADGAQVWKYAAEGSWILSTAAVDENNVYIATSDTGLMLALNKNTGAEVYRADTRLWTYASPVIARDRFIVVGTMVGELYGFAKANGEKKWYFQTPEGKADKQDLIDDKTGKLRTDKLFGADVQMQAAVENVKALGAFVASPIWINDQLITVDANGTLRVFGDALKP